MGKGGQILQQSRHTTACNTCSKSQQLALIICDLLWQAFSHIQILWINLQLTKITAQETNRQFQTSYELGMGTLDNLPQKIWADWNSKHMAYDYFKWCSQKQIQGTRLVHNFERKIQYWCRQFILVSFLETYFKPVE